MMMGIDKRELLDSEIDGWIAERNKQQTQTIYSRGDKEDAEKMFVALAEEKLKMPNAVVAIYNTGKVIPRKHLKDCGKHGLIVDSAYLHKYGTYYFRYR